MFKLCLIIMMFSPAHLIDLRLGKNSDTYGPYNLNYKRYEPCSGPKSINATAYTTDLTHIDESYIAWLNITFLEPTRFEEIKITVNTVKNNRNNLVFSYKLNNPCQHYAIAQIIEKELNAKNCAVKKGPYTRRVNFTDISYSFFGTSFFYGEYFLKVTSTSKKANILCLIMDSIFSKKKINDEVELTLSVSDSLSTMAAVQLFILLSLVYNVHLFELTMGGNSDKFGPYELEWSNYETCKGPKATNATTVVTSLEKIGEIYYGVINMTFVSQVLLDEMKIVVYTMKDNQKSILWNYKIKDICRHYAFASLIEEHLNAKNCLVKKGAYFCTQNFTEITEAFFGSSFFYGKYSLKIMFWAKKGNVLCLMLKQTFKKKNIKKQ